MRTNFPSSIFQFPSRELKSKWKMTNDKWQVQRAYTLIEILVGLTIIGVIFGVGFLSFREFSRRQSLAGGVKTLVGDLRLVQEQALAGKKPTDDIETGATTKCDNTKVLNTYDFKILSPTNYVIEADCSGGKVRIKSVALSSDLTLTSTANTISFKPIGQGTLIPEGEEIVITLTQAGSNATQIVTVTSGGEIK